MSIVRDVNFYQAPLEVTCGSMVDIVGYSTDYTYCHTAVLKLLFKRFELCFRTGVILYVREIFVVYIIRSLKKTKTKETKQETYYDTYTNYQDESNQDIIDVDYKVVDDDTQ